MALQSVDTMLAADAFNAIRQNAAGWKAQAQNALASLSTGSVDSDFVFRMLDQLAGAIAALNQWKAIGGLDVYATSQGYTGTLSADCATAATAAQSCITWVVTNFPASGGFIEAYSLNADGSRTARSFTSTQTAGLQSALSAFIASIS